MRAPRRRQALSSAGITPTPLLVFGAMLSASIAIRCASKADSVEPNNTGGASAQGGSTPDGGTASGGAASAGMAGNVSTGGFISVGGSGGAPGAPCTVANVANDCPLPPSVCQGPLSLTYYTAPACVAGQCTYAEQTYLCPGSCMSGACGASTMTTSSMPPDPRCTGSMGGTTGNGSGGVNGEAGAGGAMGARIIIGGAGFGAGGAISTAGGSGAGMSGAGSMGSSSCTLPASSCTNATTLVYYTNPHCSAFLQCTYMVNTLDCMGPCTNGACQGGFTAPAAP